MSKSRKLSHWDKFCIKDCECIDALSAILISRKEKNLEKQVSEIINKREEAMRDLFKKILLAGENIDWYIDRISKGNNLLQDFLGRKFLLYKKLTPPYLMETEIFNEMAPILTARPTARSYTYKERPAYGNLGEERLIEEQKTFNNLNRLRRHITAPR